VDSVWCVSGRRNSTSTMRVVRSASAKAKVVVVVVVSAVSGDRRRLGRGEQTAPLTV
jgi:hypothetical protein